ncbi:DNA mismatch repair protein MutS [Halalkaliarchaeum desulfuricum]|uniref:DNA mismatch repair protein MutS n=1 Tax=Halalkaliarchaeum desulfuricum TaxID=2055893 RepID=A0A343TFP4_9EURY|nr:DNA mismatch repair protein MutS [Halalkaliarchaeum desulfuricum]AUX07916.1 DNA mismatch repair protein MutS [Halalkaliarchaeum desulfuricum]
MAKAGIDEESVTGVPPSMAPVAHELTPMLTQYVELCADHEDALVLFQVGDFYEAFCEAAEAVARICEVTLTQREDSTGEYPMAGIPIDNAASYLEPLLEAGYRVAIADQVEDAEEATGLVDRAVTQVITPGTIVDDELLDSGAANYVAAVAGTKPTDGTAESRATDGELVGLAAVDVSTGECLVTDGDRATIAEELQRIAPAELLRSPDAPEFSPDTAGVDWDVNAYDPAAFELDRASDRLGEYVTDPERRFSPAQRRAAGAVLAYAEYTQGDDGPLEYVSRARRYDTRDHLRLDSAALRSLELFENRGSVDGTTLFDSLDRTVSALGRRRLERWLRRPLVDRDRIEARHDAVAELADRPIVREEIRDRLAAAYDLERLVGRISRGRADARDLRSLFATLEIVPELRDALSDGDATDAEGDAPKSDALEKLHDRLDPLADVRELIDEAIAPDPPTEITEGGIVREGYDERLDELRATERDGRAWVADLEARERDRTGIDSLKVGHNQVHGYYIEVTDPNLDRVPDDYRRRQTLKNAERFYTPGLKRREDEILGAAERADSLEYELFTDVRSSVGSEADRIQALASAIAELDALASFSTVAVEREYVRPSVRSDGKIEIEGGRHPVVERTNSEFVPNDATLPRGSIAVITGPNMSGKSTYMRQIALCVVLAQSGSFVPAQRARLPVVDRVFTRVGASDDIAGGESTFMREMAELTEVLHDATPDSLVLLDEVGRGTATTDGQAIARAAVEFVHDELEATTLFATHYHDLTTLADEYERVFNLHFTATREDGDVTFLHRVARGPSSSSYGVEVAEMAGVPDPVVQRAREFLEATDPGEPSRVETADADESGQGEDSPSSKQEVLSTLREVDLARTTPIEALVTLQELQERLDDE